MEAIEYLPRGEPACPVGWLLHQESCFLTKRRTKLNWTDSEAHCQEPSPGSHLSIPEIQQDTSWLPYKPGRSDKGTLIGLKVDGDTFRRPDDSVSSLLLPISPRVRTQAASSSVNNFTIRHFSSMSCSMSINSPYQASLSCGFRSPCLPGSA